MRRGDWNSLRFETESEAALHRRRSGGAVLAFMPVVAIVLLVASIVALLSLVVHNDRARIHAQMLSDALWVEQAFRFQLAIDDDMVTKLALDAGHRDEGTEAFFSRARIFLANNPEVIALALRDPDGRLLDSIPGFADEAAPAMSIPATRLATPSVRPVYGLPRRLKDGILVVDIATAVADHAGRSGTVVATLSLSALVARQVPWWIAERYAVRLLDFAGTMLAEKARAGPLDPADFYQMSLDPPIAGTYVAVAPYQPEGPSGSDILFAAVGGLAVFAIVSLILLQRHSARGRKVEESLSTEMAFRRAMEDSLTVGMRARDNEGRILYVNPAFCRMIGYAAEELTGRAPPMPYWLTDQIVETLARHDARIQGERKPHSYESRFRRRDGTFFDVLIYEAPLVDLDGADRGWMGSIIDITDRKASTELMRLQEASLQRTARLMTLGELASSLAHELNQPLSSITSYAAGSLNMLRELRPEPHLVVAAIEKLGLQAERAGRVVRRIQDFVRKREPHFAAVSVGDLIEDVVAFAAIDARDSGIVFRTEIANDLLPVEADRTLLEQVLLNLLKNGLESMARSTERVIRISATQVGEAIAISIADAGTGIGPEIEHRLFDAFVSTKVDGMGIGLNICRSIVELHRGGLTHAPRPGGGTVFTLRLPVARPDHTVDIGVAAAVSPAGQQV